MNDDNVKIVYVSSMRDISSIKTFLSLKGLDNKYTLFTDKEDLLNELLIWKADVFIFMYDNDDYALVEELKTMQDFILNLYVFTNKTRIAKPFISLTENIFIMPKNLNLMLYLWESPVFSLDNMLTAEENGIETFSVDDFATIDPEKEILEFKTTIQQLQDFDVASLKLLKFQKSSIEEDIVFKYNQRLEALQNEYEASVQNIQNDYASDLEDMQKEFESNLAAIEEDNAKKLEEISNKNESKVKMLVDEIDSQLEFINKQKEVQNDLNNKLNELNNKNAELDGIVQADKLIIKSLKDKLNRQQEDYTIEDTISYEYDDAEMICYERKSLLSKQKQLLSSSINQQNSEELQSKISNDFNANDIEFEDMKDYETITNAEFDVGGKQQEDPNEIEIVNEQNVKEEIDENIEQQNENEETNEQIVEHQNEETNENIEQQNENDVHQDEMIVNENDVLEESNKQQNEIIVNENDVLEESDEDVNVVYETYDETKRDKYDAVETYEKQLTDETTIEAEYDSDIEEDIANAEFDSSINKSSNIPTSESYIINEKEFEEIEAKRLEVMNKLNESKAKNEVKEEKQETKFSVLKGLKNKLNSTSRKTKVIGIKTIEAEQEEQASIVKTGIGSVRRRTIKVYKSPYEYFTNKLILTDEQKKIVTEINDYVLREERRSKVSLDSELHKKGIITDEQLIEFWREYNQWNVMTFEDLLQQDIIFGHDDVANWTLEESLANGVIQIRDINDSSQGRSISVVFCPRGLALVSSLTRDYDHVHQYATLETYIRRRLEM